MRSTVLYAVPEASFGQFPADVAREVVPLRSRGGFGAQLWRALPAAQVKGIVRRLRLSRAKTAAGARWLAGGWALLRLLGRWRLLGRLLLWVVPRSSDPRRLGPGSDRVDPAPPAKRLAVAGLFTRPGRLGPATPAPDPVQHWLAGCACWSLGVTPGC